MSTQKTDFEGEISNYDEIAIQNDMQLFKSRSPYI